jgi:hypothetical protein
MNLLIYIITECLRFYLKKFEPILKPIDLYSVFRHNQVLLLALKHMLIIKTTMKVVESLTLTMTCVEYCPQLNDHTCNH